ncbi:MAG: hypothetical protein WAN75_37840 [Xanthobacteraceae bacterium]|jgi:hypothetical protein
MNLRTAVSLHSHLDDLRVQIESARSREEAFAAVERFLESAAARQISRQGHKRLAVIVGAKIARLPPDDSAPLA